MVVAIRADVAVQNFRFRHALPDHFLRNFRVVLIFVLHLFYSPYIWAGGCRRIRYANPSVLWLFGKMNKRRHRPVFRSSCLSLSAPLIRHVIPHKKRRVNWPTGSHLSRSYYFFICESASLDRRSSSDVMRNRLAKIWANPRKMVYRKASLESPYNDSTVDMSV
jgi:hypothetical protein